MLDTNCPRGLRAGILAVIVFTMAAVIGPSALAATQAPAATPVQQEAHRAGGEANLVLPDLAAVSEVS